MNYDFKSIEEKWQNYWDLHHTFEAKNGEDKKTFYDLIEFPYPSGEGLHVGHVRVYTATDVLARMKRMQGYNVLYPMGWDAFGAPAERYAIRTHQHPKDVVKKNVAVFKRQMKTMGWSFDWSREFSTTDPEYYKWTQWQFIEFFKHGMAYKEDTKVNWCPTCKMVLSNEDAAGGVCEQCGGQVEQRSKSQWMLKMESYSEDLLKGLDDTNFADRVKIGQINWIGKSVGAHVNFTVDGHNLTFTVFTTRCDTLFGATYCVMAPEHEYVDIITTPEHRMEVAQYKEKCKLKNELERTDLNKEKTGVFTGAYAINPVNNTKIPIYISDYVLANYGTGAIMAVPAHDERDYEFAKKFNIPIIEVLKSDDGVKDHAYTGDGVHINSGFLDGLNKEEAIKKMLEFLEENRCGCEKVNYKMRDWVFGRQRFWGEPIPMIYCETCGWVPEKEENLPVRLPDVTEYEPTDNGESPLAKISEFVNCKCPQCGKNARRETDTMPQWAGSSWYFLRYMDPRNDKSFAGNDAMKYWGQVDYYDGGSEHIARHLLYARFWVQMLYNFGLVPKKEMIWTRVTHGMVLGSNNEKMSKSKGNIINPDDIVKEYGADTLRVYEMFMGDYTQDAPWSTETMIGCNRFLNRIWRLGEKLNDKSGYENESLVHKTIKKVTDDNSNLKYNTAISALMTLINEYEHQGGVSKDEYRVLLHLLNPTAPHITEELNEIYSLGKPLFESPWPVYDEEKLQDEIIKIGVQVNGKLRGTIEIVPNESEKSIKEKAFADDNVKKYIENNEIIKTIVIPGRIVNIVVKEKV